MIIRCFFGLEVPAPQRAALAGVQALLPLPRRTDAQDFHLTLVFLGDLPEDEVDVAHEVAQGLRAPAFDLVLAGLGLFRR